MIIVAFALGQSVTLSMDEQTALDLAKMLQGVMCEEQDRRMFFVLERCALSFPDGLW